MKIVDLPTIASTSTSAVIELVAQSDDVTGKITIDSIVESVKKSMGLDRVLEKCGHCGQWGAVMCACPQCGAPIDPQ